VLCSVGAASPCRHRCKCVRLCRASRATPRRSVRHVACPRSSLPHTWTAARTCTGMCTIYRTLCRSLLRSSLPSCTQSSHANRSKWVAPNAWSHPTHGPASRHLAPHAFDPHATCGTAYNTRWQHLVATKPGQITRTSKPARHLTFGSSKPLQPPQRALLASSADARLLWDLEGIEEVHRGRLRTRAAIARARPGELRQVGLADKIGDVFAIEARGVKR